MHIHSYQKNNSAAIIKQNAYIETQRRQGLNLTNTTLRSRINAPPPRLFFLKKKSDPPWIFKPRSKKIELCKTYISIRNSIKSNEIDFSECFRFQCYF